MKHFRLVFLIILFFAIFVRYYQVTSFPPSLYWEEMALGYDAYSILKTGHDHLGNPPPLIAFESYGDYKPALYFYALVPSIAIFGLTPFAIRFPSMVAGVFIVIGVGMIARLLAERYRPKQLQTMQLLAMLVTAISPWAIQFSRAGWESNVATCFIVWGVACCLTQKKKILWLLGFLFFALSMYTYHSARVIAPFLGLGVMSLWLMDAVKTKAQLKRHIMQIVGIGIFFTALIFPLIVSLQNKNVQERFAETNIFADGHVSVESNACRTTAGYSFASRFFCHRYVYTATEFLANYFLHFSVNFLFVSGDHNLRQSLQFFGELYPFDAVFLFLGCMFVLRNWRKEYAFLLFWLCIGIIPAALTDAAPHALRILPTMPVFLLLVTFGIVHGFELLTPLMKKKMPLLRIIGLGVVGVYIIQFAAFWEFYSRVYPKLYSGAWQYGYQQVIDEVNRRKNSFQNIYFTREMDRPAMAYWFFSKTDPREVQKIDKTLQKDQGPALPFENILFINFASEAKAGLVASTVVSLQQLQQKGTPTSQITYINDPAGKPIWAVYQIN